MWNKLFKKSILSKLFFMNLLILVLIVVCQLLFQALYFEKYYINNKKKILSNTISSFQRFLDKEPSKSEIIDYMDKTMKKDNVVLSLRDKELSNRIGLDQYMGEAKVKVISGDNNIYNIILGEQFVITNIKNNDLIKVVGTKDQYDNIIADEVYINGVKLSTYYEIVPNEVEAEIIMPSTLYPSVNSEKTVEMEGQVKEIVKKDTKYTYISSSDLYITEIDGKNILENEKYNSKMVNTLNNEDIIFTSEKFDNGYIIAVTALTEVNEVITTMNSYYFLLFFLLFILVIIISYIYSKAMSKPLVQMSKIAKKISECDFKYKYKATSEDEIGVLGNSLNLISNNLEKALGDLQNTNEKLKEEMDIQKLQEEKRKELIANISHELKTPITIIQGSINGIKSGMYKEDMYGEILEETVKLNDLVMEMLEVSKLESPTFKLEKGPFDLYNIILKEKDKLKGIIKEKGLKIELYGEEEAVVLGDEKRINQVVTNLLTNAIKYTPEKNKIEITLDYIKNKDSYIFKIKNYGVTLKEEDKEKIWDSFYRGEKSRNKKYGGTGLGLSIVKRILELHKSNYGVNSNKNNVEFYFTLKRYNLN